MTNILYDNWDKARFELGIIFSWWNFSYLIKNNVATFFDEVSDFKKEIGNDYEVSNGISIYIENSYGQLFKMYFNRLRNGLTYTVYDSCGGTTIRNGKFMDEGGNQVEMNAMKDAMDNFTLGYIYCSDCGSKQRFSDIERNRYFAGIYCDDCWNGKWKAIEAKEDYN